MQPSLLPVQNERISARLLNDDRYGLDYLKKLQKKIQAPSLLVAASQFSKRYARFLTEAAFSPIYLEQRYPLMTLDDAELVTDWSGKMESVVCVTGAQRKCRQPRNCDARRICRASSPALEDNEYCHPGTNADAMGKYSGTRVFPL